MFAATVIFPPAFFFLLFFHFAFIALKESERKGEKRAFEKGKSCLKYIADILYFYFLMAKRPTPSAHGSKEGDGSDLLWNDLPAPSFLYVIFRWKAFLFLC